MQPAANAAAARSSIAAKLARFGRFVIFLCTAGWAFPHVCTEDLDLTRIQKDYMKDAQ